MKNLARLSLGLVAFSALALACGSGNPPAADLGSPTPGKKTPAASATTSEDSGSIEEDAADSGDAGNRALDAADAFDGYYPPPKSECDPDMTIGAAASLPGSATPARFAGITRDELTVAWTVTGATTTSLFVADRTNVADDFGSPQTVSSDIAADSVAITVDGLHLVATAPDHRSFVAFDRVMRADDFAVGDDTPFDRLVEALDPTERIGDPVFVNSGLVLLYSVYGKSTDTMRLGNRVSIYAGFYPAYTLAFDEFRAQGTLRRRPTGTGDDFQVIFYWDEVSQTEKLARMNGTETILSVRDLGAHPWAQPNQSCRTLYFGAAAIQSAATK